MARRSTTPDAGPDAGPDDGTDDGADGGAIAAAADTLYATEPEEFVDARARLVKQARAADDAAAATRIGRLRKPTVAAFVVNRHVLAGPDGQAAVEQLLDLHRRLRDAQTSLDPETLRRLTAERRSTVGELTRAALAGAGRSDAPTGLRDEVLATFDAAVADPDVAGRLGRLVRAEHWSGFGVAGGDLPPDSPALRLVRGSGGERPARPAPRKRADGRRSDRALRDAEQAVATAEATLADAQQAERTIRDRVHRLTDEIATLQARLDDARTDQDAARREVTKAKNARRKAQTALDRARRDADT